MNINLNADKILDKITANPWLIITGILIALTTFFAYMFHTEKMRTAVNCDEEIKKLRDDNIELQIKFNDEMLSLRTTHRKQIDSLETYYYNKLLVLERKLQRMEGKVINLENITSPK